MNFARDDSEEVRRLKKQVTQQNLEITQLHSEKQREQARQDTLIQERNSLHQRLDAAEVRQVQLENDFDRVKEDRDHQRLACTNLEQVYQSTKAQLHEKERGSRLLSHDSDRESQRLIRAAEENAEKAQARCRLLEEQLREAQSVVQANERQRGNSSKQNGDATERAAALENEVTVLKAEVDRLQRRSSGLPPSPSGSSQGGRYRRPQASSVSDASSSEMQQLRVTIEEAEAKVGTLEVRAAKAEREALKASNERIALVKSSELAIAELKSTVADLKDEAAFQRHHVLKKLEAEVETLRADSSRASSLEMELQASKTLCVQSEKRLCEKESHTSSLQRGIDELQSRLVEARERNDVLVQQVCNAEGVAKLLARRDKEVASAKKRLRILAATMRRTLLGVASSPAGEWEEGSQTTLGEADDSTLQNTTVSRDFETDLLDEMDQLLGYVEEADGRVEFAKVEQSIQDRSALTERQKLQAKITALEEELRRLKEDNDRQRLEQDNLLASIDALQTEKDRIEEEWLLSVDAGRTAASEQETLIAQIAALKEDGRGEREQGVKKQQDMQSTIDSLTAQRDQQDDLRQASQARLEEAEREMIALQTRIAGLDEALQAVERTREGEEAQRQGLLSQIEILTEKDVNSEDKLAQASKSIQQLQRAVTVAELEAAKLALEATEDRMRLGSEARLSSDHFVATLEQSQEALREEGEQWNALLKDLQRHLSESHAALSSSEVEREGEQNHHSQAIALLERELHDARAGMDKARELVKALELDLQEGRTNQQLAEDTLKRLVPSREGDVTVCADTPSGESLRETYDLRIQLQQAVEADQEGKDLQESEQGSLRAATEDAERWRAETTVRDEQLAQAQTEQMQTLQALETLEARLQEAGAAQAEMTASIQRMEALLWERDTALQASQRAIEEHTKEKAALLLEAEEQRTLPSTGYAAEMQLLESRLDASESRRSALQAQVDGLESTITQIQAEHCEHEAQRSDLQAALDALQASNSALRQTHAEMEAELVAAGERVDKLNGEVEVLEEAARRETQEAERATVELEKARERYETLRKQLEDRNAEYWEAKEELAEWQEQHEQSQVDAKIKNDLEERLKETEHALDEARGAQKEQEVLYRTAQKQAEESRLQVETLQMAMPQGQTEGARVAEIEEQLAAATGMIEQLEQDLAHKAQECEDADDKELALRKDNKKLAARIATLQAKVDKLLAQTPRASIGSKPASAVTMANKASDRGEGVGSGNIAAGTNSSGSRKRRAPEEDDSTRECEAQTATTRAIYAPKPAPLTTTNTVRAIAPAKNSAVLTSRNMAPPPVAVGKKTPSELLASKLRSPGREATLQDRTNLLSRQPSLEGGQSSGRTGQDSNFMTKINRFRGPSTHIMAGRVGSSPHG